jgi:hypothetical protein
MTQFICFIFPLNVGFTILTKMTNIITPSQELDTGKKFEQIYISSDRSLHVSIANRNETSLGRIENFALIRLTIVRRYPYQRVKEPSLLKAGSAKLRSKFAALSSVAI